MKMQKILNKEEFKEYHISKPIKKTLDKSKHHVLTKDWDRVFIIDGAEGAGKSLLGLQLGYYLDRTLNLDRVTFSGEDFKEAINKAEKGQCIIFDEAFNGLSSSGAMSSMNKLIVTNLQECRQKNLFIIIILPTIFLLQKYVAIFRSQCLFHVWSASNGERGFYRVYNRNNNHVNNLEWITGSDNKKHSHASGNRKNNSRPVNQLDRNTKEIIQTFESIKEAYEQTGCNRCAISFFLT